MLNSGQKSNAGSTGEIFIAQPDAEKEALAGKLFVLAEVESGKADAIKIINFLINNINHNYYQNEKIILRERISALKIEHIFESSLAKTNKHLAEFLIKEKIKINPNLLNITIGIIYENELHFSSIGKNKTFILYKEKSDDKKSAIEKYKIIEITKSNSVKNHQKLNSAKIFSNVISGEIPSRGYSFFANEALPEYLSNKQLIKIITKLQPAGAAEQIKNTLMKINAYVSFLGIIIKNTSGLNNTDLISDRVKLREADEYEKKEPYDPVSAQNSIDSLSYTEEKTEKLLAPSGIINFKEKFKKISRLIKRTFTKSGKKIKNSERMFLLKDKILMKKKPTFLYIKKNIYILKNIIIYFINLIIYIIKIFVKKEQRDKFILNIKSLHILIIKKVKKLLNWFKNLSKKNKILLITTTACLILLIFSLSLTRTKNKINEQKEITNNLIKNIEQKQNQIDANLLYSNEEGAKTILEEIEKLLTQVPNETEEEIENYKKIVDKNNQQIEKIQHVVKIEDKKELANFVNLNSRAKTENIILQSETNKIYSGDKTQGTIYTLDLKDNLITAIVDLNKNIESLKYPITDKNKNIYYLSGASTAPDSFIIKINPETEEISNLTINLPTSENNIIAATEFNNKLYLLDNKNSQIYRYDNGVNGFTNLYKWVLEKADFSDAVDISIDGYIYILKKDGSILKYLKGEKQEFKLESISPEFKKASKIIVSPEFEYIYILEPIEKRLAVFNKIGKFLMQYKADDLENLNDFAIDEKNKKIYLLNNTSVYEIEASHFEE